MAYQPKPRWTNRQEHFVRTNCHKMTDQEIADILGKTLKSVRRKRERMIIPKKSGRGRCELELNKNNI
jgi:hypothetical protein